MTNFGKELRKIRLDLGITLYDMASAIGVSSAMLSSVETGKKPAPAQMVEQLASRYPQVKARYSEFASLADQTKTDVKVRLGSDQKANELAVAFARKFDELSAQDIQDLMAVFKRKP
ncbi:MAG: XRE family transcriptional regulator [Alphaproteobacteria bacterium]|nr:MAG: XRE family transcriptional regulator [Alphaproteobacteria bacterium]